MKPRCFIALHIGAGYHSPLKEPEYRRLCTRACRMALKHLHAGRSCLDVVELVCIYLEDSPLTNAGYGSNLSINGSVECDAAIMESSSSSFGAVTCVREVKNPIKLARIVLNEQKVPGKLIPPLVLAGEGARLKAISSGLELVSNEVMTSPQAVCDHKRYKRVLDEDEYSPQTKRIKLDHSVTNEGKTNRKEDSSSVDVKTENSKSCHSADKEMATVSSFSCMANLSDSFSEFAGFDTGTTPQCQDISNVDMPVLGSCSPDDHKNQYPCDNKALFTPNKNRITPENEAPSLGNPTKEKDRAEIKGRTFNSTQFVNQNGSQLDDTIGVICVDDKLNLASGVSSGGILLKHPGRVSHASHFGCGCWAYRYCDEFSVASVTSGCGELLVRTGLAKKAAEHCLRKTDTVLNYADFLKKKFLHSKYLDHAQGQRSCGLLLVKLLRLPNVSKDEETTKIVESWGEEKCGETSSKFSEKSQFSTESQCSEDANTSDSADFGDLKQSEISQCSESSQCSEANLNSSDIIVDSNDLAGKASSTGEKSILDLHIAHTSESFCVCYTSSEMKKPRFILSRLDKDKVGKEVLTQGFTMKL